MKTFLLLILIAFSFTVNSATITVTNTNDSGAGSFRQAVADANMGDIIRFDPSLISGGSDTILFSTPVVINKGLFFNGLFNATDTLFFSGGGTSSILNIAILNGTSYPHLDFDSLVFIDGNGAVSTYGGAIKIDNQSNIGQVPKIYIRNCAFRNNSAPFGGAIGTYSTFAGSTSRTVDIEMYDCTFKSNSATGSGSDGGAIYIYRQHTGATTVQPRIDLVMERCNFLSNESQDKGGAIFMHAENYTGSTYGIANLTITGSSFNANSSINSGGAIYMNTFDSYAGEVSNSTLTAKTSTFTNNSVVTNGGAIYLQSCNHTNVFLYACTLIGNTALNDGSAIYQKLAGTTVELSNEISLGSNIFLSNNGNSNYNNTIYHSGNVTYFGTDETNIFDCLESDLQFYNDQFYEDLFGSTLAQVNLLPLALNSRNTYTMIPDLGSIAINAANTFITNEAQNGPILGVRDIGAAESPYCDAILSNQSDSICQGSFYNFYGQILSNAGTYFHTIVTPNQCDTLITLTFSLQNPLTTAVNINSNPGNTIMTGTSVTFTATPINGGTNPTYQWLVNGVPTGPSAPSVSTSGLTNGDIVSCIMTSNNACVISTTAQSNAIDFIVHSNNDEPCDAILLNVNQSCEFSYFANHIATNTPNVGAHSCASSTSNDIWFQFVAPASGYVEIHTLSGTLTDAVLSVYDGTCSSLFETGCVDDDGVNQMPQGFLSNATPGTTYYIRVSSFGTVASGNFAICLLEMNSNPVTNDDASSTDYLTPVTVNVLANDSDLGGNIIPATLTISTQSANGVAVANANGTITFTPNSGFSGITTFQYQICDDGTPALCATATVTITVAPDSNPVANNDVVSTPYFTPITIDVVTNDFDLVGNLVNSSLSIFVQSINGLAVANANGTITFTPNNGFSGLTTFEYQICDNETPALCATATVSVTVGANSSPLANNDVSSTDFSTPITIDVLTNDSDSDGNLLPSSITISTQSLDGVAVANTDGTITFTPTDGFAGVTTFEYQICDGGIPALCATATVTVNVGVNSVNVQTIFSSIYPNPTSKTLTVKTNGKLNTLKILSLEGKLLAEHSIFENINIEELSSGVYFLELIFENGKISRNQFVKE